MWSARGVATHAGVLSCSAARAPQRARATSTGFFDLVYDSKRRFDLQQPQHDLQRPLKTYLQYKETIGLASLSVEQCPSERAEHRRRREAESAL